ncbi:HNH endonuclease [Frankia sp. CeD]|uniref:HNH endonuclease n=1 Tax=Frankia sp. CeD TaxID=258230 RepID=UPI00055DD4E2|nr:HNH endonuclease [Frankia sp. CeD]
MREYTAAAGDRINAREREKYASASPEEIIRRRQASAEYHRRNRARIIVLQRERYARLTPEQREAHRSARARRKVRLRIAMTAEDRQASVGYRIATMNDPCFYCGSIDETHIDHFIPLARGGTEHWWNLVRACPPCNMAKHARCGTYFALMKGCGEPRRTPSLPEADPVNIGG